MTKHSVPQMMSRHHLVSSHLPLSSKNGQKINWLQRLNHLRTFKVFGFWAGKQVEKTGARQTTYFAAEYCLEVITRPEKLAGIEQTTVNQVLQSIVGKSSLAAKAIHVGIASEPKTGHHNTYTLKVAVAIEP